MKEFNTTAVCIPTKHYMVDISENVEEIRKLVDAGKYFTINRARQYGKTTTLNALANALNDQYIVFSTSFEGIGDAGFASEKTFVKEFCRLLRREFKRGISVSEDVKETIDDLSKRRSCERDHDKRCRFSCSIALFPCSNSSHTGSSGSESRA